MKDVKYRCDSCGDEVHDDTGITVSYADHIGGLFTADFTGEIRHICEDCRPEWL